MILIGPAIAVLKYYRHWTPYELYFGSVNFSAPIIYRSANSFIMCVIDFCSKWYESLDHVLSLNAVVNWQLTRFIRDKRTTRA